MLCSLEVFNRNTVMLISSQQVAIMVPIHESRFVTVLQSLRTRCRDPLASELFDSVNFVLLEFCLKLCRLIAETFRFFGQGGLLTIRLNSVPLYIYFCVP